MIELVATILEAIAEFIVSIAHTISGKRSV
jgi:hypothetical protein